MFDIPLNIVQILVKLYPDCRVGCNNCDVSLEEQFKYVVWIDEDKSGKNPEIKPTWNELSKQIEEIQFKDAKNAVWEEVKKIHSDLSAQKSDDFTIAEEKTASKKSSLLATANDFGAQIKAAKTLDDLKAIDYKKAW
jgi:hypothetical protein